MSALILKIDEAYMKEPVQAPRRYIGASSLGECEAEIAYCLRGFPGEQPRPQIARIFKLGHVLEDMVLADLKLAGYTVYPVDPATGQQWTYKAFGGHVVCHLDGIVWLEPMPEWDIPRAKAVLEVKSMNKSMFAKLQREGVRNSHPKYYNQMQACMMLAGLEWAMLVAYCKDNSDYHIEIVKIDQITVSHLEVMIHRALTNQARRISDTPVFFKCKFCFKRSVCHGDTEVPRCCATCQHALAHKSGGWECTLSNEVNHADDICHGYERYKALTVA
ncbi:MAG: hypothetical protein ACRCXB_21360 [Aeromonadaceae bacterium]